MLFLLSLLSLSLASPSAPRDAGWSFEVVGQSGILALESMVISPTHVLFFDRAANDPLTINGHPAWGALWNLETSTSSPLNLLTDTFCASGVFLSNGTMVRVSSQQLEIRLSKMKLG
jgi:hypothetical protein